MLKLKKIPVKKSDYSLPEPSNDIPYYNPSFSVNDKQIKEIADWDVGETYQVVLNIKMTRKEEYKGGSSAGFDIVEYKVIDDLTDGEIEDMQAEGLSS